MESLVVFVEDPKHHRGPWPMLKAPEVSRHQKDPYHGVSRPMQ